MNAIYRNLVLLFMFLLMVTVPDVSFTAKKTREQQPATEDSERLSNGAYEGYYRRAFGMARVRVIIEEGRMTRIDIIDRFCSPFGKKAFLTMPRKIIDAQSTNVDSVTGATYSSENIKRAVEDALLQSRQK